MKEGLRLLTLLAIGICALGCDNTSLWPGAKEETDDQGVTEHTAQYITAMARGGDTLYLATKREGLFRLNNRLQSWEYALVEIFVYSDPSLATDNTTLYACDQKAIYRLEPDGENVTRITPLWNEWIPVIVWAVEGDTIYATRQTQLLRSTDRGNSWHLIQPPNGADVGIHSLAVKGNKIAVFTEHQKVVYSTDDGEKWTVITKGLPDTKLPTWTRAPLHFYKNTLYIGTIEGLYRIIEGTNTFISAGLDDRYVTSIVTSQNALYVCTWHTGVFRSTDGGESWQKIGPRGVSVTALALFDNRIYVGSFIRGVFYTDDGGANWHPLNKGLTQFLE